MLKNLLPGMMCKGTEFFRFEDQLMVIKAGRVKAFSEMSGMDVEILNEAIKSDPDVEAALVDMHPASGIDRLRQFVSCRFSGLDSFPDMVDGKLQDGEYWPCPKRGSCPHEGVLCKLPVINGNRLEPIEVKLIQLSTTDKKNEVIADMLNLPMGTFHLLKNKIHKKLAVQTKQELTAVAGFWNLFWPQG